MSDNEERWESLPAEIPTPIKSIITCTSFSKTWNSQIQNPTFISTHLHHSHNKNKNLLLFSLYSQTHKESYALQNEDDPHFTQHSSFDYPFHVPFLQSPYGTFRAEGTSPNVSPTPGSARLLGLDLIPKLMTIKWSGLCST